MDDHDGNGRTVAEAQRLLIARAREQAREIRSSAAGDPPSMEVYSPYQSGSLGPPPDSFTGYQILGELHRGGQGIVYQAIQKSTRRKVAIKVMKEGPFASATEKARFDREVQVLGQLKHPNIVAIHGTGLAAGHHFFVMDYIHGQPLDVYVAGRPHGIDEIFQLFAKIGDAVGNAHLRGIIHRDLKPSNVRIDDNGEPHILDFGLARAAPTGTDASFMTVTGQFVGSLPWASPEQAEGVPGKIDIRTDVYSLGVMLYQMLTGRFPYDIVGNMRDVLDRILHAEPRRPRILRADINDEVETILLRCLEKEPQRRYQSAGELTRDIRHYLAGEPIEAKRDSTIYVLRKRLRKHWIPVSVIAAFLLTILIGFVVSAAGWRHAASERDSAQAASNEADRERDAAEDARQQAEAVTGFLGEMLGSANPYSSRGPNATIREVLDGAASRIEVSFDDQPLVKATLHETIAGSYNALGVFSEGQIHAQRALALRRDALPADHPDIARILSLCASTSAATAHYTEAAAYARESLDIRRKRFGPRNEHVAESLTQLGIALGAQGRFSDAEPVYREAAEQLEGIYGTQHGETFRANYRLGCCLMELGRLDEAEPLLEQNIRLAREALGPEHPELGNMLASHGESLHLAGNFEAAEAAYRESLTIRRKAFGDDHITIANSYNVLAFLLVDQKRFEEAEPLYLQSLEMRRRLYGSRRVEVTFALNGLARLYLRTERPVEAEVLLRESLGMFDENHPTHWRRGYAECLLGAALTLQDRFDEAEPLLVDGVSIIRTARGDSDSFTREVLQYAIDLYDAWGKPQEATPFRALLLSD